MDYLVVQLGWYIAAAFVVGLVIGWNVCGRSPSAEK